MFSQREEGLLERAGSNYDIDDDTDKGLTLPYLLQHPNNIATLSISPRLAHSYTITIIDDPFSPPRYDVEEEPSSRCITPSPSYPQDCE